MLIYIAHSRKTASNALNVPSTDQKDTSSVYDESSQFAYPAYANCFGTSSVSLVHRCTTKPPGPLPELRTHVSAINISIENWYKPALLTLTDP